MIQTLIQLTSYGYDPTHVLQRLNKLLILCPCSSDIVLLGISKTLSLCSSKFVLKIVDFCNTHFYFKSSSKCYFCLHYIILLGLKVIQNYGCHKIIGQTVVASILQWNRTKVINDDTMKLFLTIVNSDCKPTFFDYFYNNIYYLILIFSVIIIRSCTQNHKLLPFLTTDSFLITSYLLTK